MLKISNEIIEDCMMNFVHHTTSMVIIADEYGKIMYSNQAFKSMLKLDFKKDVLQDELKLWQYVSPYSKWLCQDVFSSMAPGENDTLEIVFKDKNGIPLHTEGKFTCVLTNSEATKMIVGIIEDVSERNMFTLEHTNLMRQLEQNTDYLNLVYKAYGALLEESDLSLDQRICQVLALLGEKVYADRAFVIYYDFVNGLITNPYEWCAEDIQSKKAGFQDKTMSTFKTWIDVHRDGERIYIEDVGRLPYDDSIRNSLEPFGVMSTVSIPLIKNGECYGCIGFDSVKINRTNAEFETKLLSDISGVLLNEIIKKRL